MRAYGKTTVDAARAIYRDGFSKGIFLADQPHGAKGGEVIVRPDLASRHSPSKTRVTLLKVPYRLLR
jgi:hypothetical protein